MYPDIPRELRERIEPVVESHGLELVDVELHEGRGPWILRVMTNLYINQYHKLAKQGERVDLEDVEEFSIYATLYYQAIPPYYLKERFATAKGPETQRLYLLTSGLDTSGMIKDWKLLIGSSGRIAVKAQ